MSARYLVDTDVISEGSRSGAVTRADLVRWMDENSSRLFLSTITIAEIEDGIAAARRRGSRRKAARLTEWLEATLAIYGNRVLAFDVAAARAAGILSERSRARGRPTGFPDVAIAATAVAHDLTVLSRNVRHFRYLEVPAHNPFSKLPMY